MSVSIATTVEPTSEIIFVLENQKEFSITYSDRRDVFKSYGENDNFYDNKTEIERWSSNTLCETSIVEMNCQEAAWKTFENLLENQNNAIDSLVFKFKFSENPQSFNFSPPFPQESIECKSLKMTGKKNYWLVYAIIGAVKPCLENLYVDQIGYPFNLSTEFGKKIQVKTAKKLFCTIAMKNKEVMNLEGMEISIDPLYFNQCFVVNLMKKSIETGNPKKFRVFRGCKNRDGVLKNFDFHHWSSDFSEKFKFDYETVPGCQYYLVNLPGFRTSLFIEFCNGRRDVIGFILEEK